MGPLNGTGRVIAPRLACRSPPTATASLMLEVFSWPWVLPSFVRSGALIQDILAPVSTKALKCLL